MDYFRKNYDIIVKDIFFESDLIEAINSLSSDIKVTYKNNKDDFFEENSDPMISENNENNEDFNSTIKELNDILIKIEDYQHNEIGKSIFNLYENELKNFSLILEANISFEGTSELNNFISIFEDLCDYAYNDSFIDSCRAIILSTSFPTISEEEIDNFTKSNIEIYSTILKDLYKETNQIYEDVYSQLNQYIETMFADINKAFGKLGGFTIIDGFNYIEEPCKDSNCSYSISFPSFKDIVNQESEKKNGRRLEEKDYIGELRETISEMKKILHKSKDFRIFKSSENNESSLYNKRKLEFEFYNKEEKYTSKSGAREETHVNLTISKFKSNTGTLVNKLYYGIQGMEKYLDFSFISMHLNSLRNKVISDFLLYLKGILENENDYYLLEDMIMKSLNIITNIFSDILILLIEKKKIVINKLKDQYLYLSLIEDYLPNYILNYYRMLNQIISVKTVSYTKKEEYDVHFDEKIFEEEYKRNKEMLDKFSKSQNKYVKDIEEGTKDKKDDDDDDYDDVLDEDFGYGDLDYDKDEFASGFIPYPDDLDDDDSDDNVDYASKLDELADKMKKKK